MIKVTVVLFAGLAVSMAACKPAKSDGSGGGKTEFPAPVGGAGDATATQKIGILGTGGGKRITVNLERIPEHGSANLWACWNVPDDTFEMGKAVCRTDPTKFLAITAANIEFYCTTNNDFGVIRAKHPISLDHCDSYDVFAFEFTPPLDMKIVE